LPAPCVLHDTDSFGGHGGGLVAGFDETSDGPEYLKIIS